MLGYGLLAASVRRRARGLGLALATGGLLVLTLPAASRPGSGRRGADGLWPASPGRVYTLAGRASREPIAANARNFLWSSALALLLVLLGRGRASSSAHGAALAVISGAVTSGLGYVVWYRALPRLSVTQAAVAQVVHAGPRRAGATLLLGEHVSARLAGAGAAVLIGVALAMAPRTGRA